MNPDLNLDHELDPVLARLKDRRPPPLSAAVLDTIGDSPAAVRPIWPVWARVALATIVGGVGAAVSLTLIGSRFASVAELGVGPLLLAIGWVAATVVLTWLAVTEAEPLAPVASWPRVLVLSLLALAFAAVAFFDDIHANGAIDILGSQALIQGARGCLAMGSVIETGPVLVLFLLLARGSPMRPLRAGILGGVAAGGWSILALTLHCPSTSAMHVIPFHLGVALIWGLLGALVGLWLRRR